MVHVSLCVDAVFPAFTDFADVDGDLSSSLEGSDSVSLTSDDDDDDYYSSSLSSWWSSPSPETAISISSDACAASLSCKGDLVPHPTVVLIRIRHVQFISRSMLPIALAMWSLTMWRVFVELPVVFRNSGKIIFMMSTVPSDQSP